MEVYHFGVSKRDGAKVGSGRYPLGSGDRPYQRKNIKMGNKGGNYYFKDKNGKVISELNVYNFDMDGFDWDLIADVETNKDYRRQGLSTKLLDKAISNVKDKDVSKGVYLLVKTNNSNAISLYKKLAFDTVKEQNIDGEKYYVMANGPKNNISQLKDMNFS